MVKPAITTSRIHKKIRVLFEFRERINKKKKLIIKDKNTNSKIIFDSGQTKGQRRDVKGERGMIRRGSHAWDDVLWQPRVITLVTFNSPRIRNTACKSILSDRPIFSSVLVFIQTPIYIRIYIQLTRISIDAPQRVALRVHSWLDTSTTPPPRHSSLHRESRSLKNANYRGTIHA